MRLENYWLKFGFEHTWSRKNVSLFFAILLDNGEWFSIKVVMMKKKLSKFSFNVFGNIQKAKSLNRADIFQFKCNEKLAAEANLKFWISQLDIKKLKSHNRYYFYMLGIQKSKPSLWRQETPNRRSDVSLDTRRVTRGNRDEKKTK